MLSTERQKKRWVLFIAACLCSTCFIQDINDKRTPVSQSLRRLSSTVLGGTGSNKIKEYYQSKVLENFTPAYSGDGAPRLDHPHPQTELNELPPRRRTGPGDDTVFLLGIFSTALVENRASADRLARRNVRNTYTSYMKDSRVCNLNNYIRMKNNGEHASAKVCKVLYTFVMGGNTYAPTDHYKSNEPLTVDGKKLMGDLYEPDATYLNIQENIVGGKSPTWFKYGASLASKYGIDYVGKCDTDTLISMPHLIDFIITDLPPMPYNSRTLGSRIIKNHHRAGVGNIYPSGQFYYMSSDLAYYISSDELDRQSMVRVPRHRVIGGKAEDYDVGTLVQSHPYPIKYVMMNHRIIWQHSADTPGYNLKKPDEFMNFWEDTKGVIPAARRHVLGYPLPQA